MKCGTCRQCNQILLLIFFQFDIKTWPDFYSVFGDVFTKHIMATGLHKSQKLTSMGFPFLVKVGGHIFFPVVLGRYPLGKFFKNEKQHPIFTP
jgi:hypothetical protein